MPRNSNSQLNALPAARHPKAEKPVEEMSLHELRQALEMTQVNLAKSLGVAPKEIAEIEKRTDMHISTLRRLIEALGGKLSLIAEFPDRPPVTLSGITGSDSKSIAPIL